jgi:hypothetical protein
MDTLICKAFGQHSGKFRRWNIVFV